MKRILIALLLAVGLLTPMTFIAPSAQAVTCGDTIIRDGDVESYHVDVGAPGGAYKNGYHYGRVYFKWCYPASGSRFAKVSGYSVINNQESDACANMDDFHYDPNAIGWWNPEPRRSIPCEDGGPTGVQSWSCCGSTDVNTVNVYASDPANERCIAAEAVAGIAPGGDFAIDDVPTICFLS